MRTAWTVEWVPDVVGSYDVKRDIARGSVTESDGILYGNLERTISCYDCRANQPVYCCCSDAKFGRDLALALSLTALALHGY